MMKRPLRTPEEFFSEAVRYYRNARHILSRVPIEYEQYADPKPVAEASAIVYKAVLYAVNGYLLRFGAEVGKLPRDEREIRKVLRRTAQQNGKLLGKFNTVYDSMHVTAYYGDITSVIIIKPGLESARWIIVRLTGRKP